MEQILQGTTPSLEIKINKSDFLVTDVIKLELLMRHNGNTLVYGLSDVSVNAESNSVTYQFTEAETLALYPGRPFVYQIRFMFMDGSIVGTEEMSLSVKNLLSRDVMTT